MKRSKITESANSLRAADAPTILRNSACSLLLVLALVAAACTKNEQNDRPASVETTTDSLVATTSCGDYSLTIETPRSGNRLLDCAIVEYIAEEFGGQYLGDLADTKALLQQTLDSIRTQFDQMGSEIGLDSTSEMRLYCRAKATKLYETSAFVTYEVQKDEFAGGQHGQFTKTGQTFRKRDARRLGWEVVSGWGTPEMNSLVVDGLKKYLNTATDDELAQYLLVSPDQLPRPATPPIFGPEGLIVRYQQYEIAPYAAGMPECVIPYDRLETLLLPRIYSELR